MGGRHTWSILETQSLSSPTLLVNPPKRMENRNVSIANVCHCNFISFPLDVRVATDTDKVKVRDTRFKVGSTDKHVELERA